MQLIKIFDGSFGGAVLFENPDYVCPNTVRRQRRLASANKYVEKVHAKDHLRQRREAEPVTFAVDPVFEAVYGAGEQKGDQEATNEVTGDVQQLKRKIDRVRKAKNKKGKKKQKTSD